MQAELAEIKSWDVDVHSAAADVASMLKDMEMAEAPTGQVTVWRIEGFEPTEVDASLHGQFYAGDSYIVKHTSKPRGGTREHVTLYTWLGSASTS